MQNEAIENVIFDLDGTLLDTRKGVLDSVIHTIDILGYPKLDDEQLQTFIGPPIQLSFINHYQCTKQEAQEAAEVFRNYYSNVTLFGASPYDGIYELCENLLTKGKRLAVATYKREDYALRLLKHFHFDKYCNPMHGADNNNLLKKEDIVKLCIQEMNGTKGNSVLVGDTVHDGLGAEKAGIRFIGVTYGFGYRTPQDVKTGTCIGVAATPIEIQRFV